MKAHLWEHKPFTFMDQKLNHILIPTDFSAAALHSALVGLTLASQAGARVTFLHAWHIPPGAGDFAGLAESQIEAEAQRELAEFVDRASAGFAASGQPLPPIAAVCAEGFAGDVVPQQAQDLGAGLIVMGTQGATGAKEILLGSITSTLVHQTQLPVLAVPAQAQAGRFSRVAFAVNWEDEVEDSLTWLLPLVLQLGARFELVHVLGEGETTDFLNAENLLRAFPSLSQLNDWELVTVRAASVTHGLNRYIEEAHPDLLVMTTHDRGFIRRIFSPSLTERMVNHAKVPVMALH